MDRALHVALIALARGEGCALPEADAIARAVSAEHPDGPPVVLAEEVKRRAVDAAWAGQLPG